MPLRDVTRADQSNAAFIEDPPISHALPSPSGPRPLGRYVCHPCAGTKHREPAKTSVTSKLHVPEKESARNRDHHGNHARFHGGRKGNFGTSVVDGSQASGGVPVWHSRTTVSPVVEAWSTYRTGIGRPVDAPAARRRQARHPGQRGDPGTQRGGHRRRDRVDHPRRTSIERVPLVDELIVVDSRSTDATAAVAAAAGAQVVSQDADDPGPAPARRQGRRALGRASPPPAATSSRSSTATCEDFRAALRHRPARPAAHRPGASSSSRASTTAPLIGRRASSPTAAAGSPSWPPARCSTCSGRSWPASSSRSPASTPAAATSWSGSRSSPGTASRPRC